MPGRGILCNLAHRPDRRGKNQITMTKIQNILRCYASGMPIKAIATAFEISRNTVRKYVRMYLESNIPMDSILTMPWHQVQELFGGKVERKIKPSERRVALEALLPDYALRLKRKGVTVQSLFSEYKDQYPDGYKHAQFEALIRRYRLETKVVGHVEHYAADQMYIDFAGDRLEIVDDVTGEPVKVEVFVAILPCSQYTYCEAVRSQKKEDLIRACENALWFYGGAPRAIVPDNLKSAVTRSDRNEPVINPDFAAFAEHYGCAVYPARVRHPKDKALVENAVKLMYRTVYVDIEGMVFHSLEELNSAIAVSLERFNNRCLTRRSDTRRGLFEKTERDYLGTLPGRRYQMRQRKTVTVARNSYVTLFKHHYSVPVRHAGEKVDIVFDADIVEIYQGFSLITAHRRDDTPYQYTQKPSHGLPGRNDTFDTDMEKLYESAVALDNAVLLYMREVAAYKKYPPMVFSSCRGIMSLKDRYGAERLVSACLCATELKAYGYQPLRDILEHGDDTPYLEADGDCDDVPVTPAHKNIRGAEYFAISSTLNKSDNGNDQ